MIWLAHVVGDGEQRRLHRPPAVFYFIFSQAGRRAVLDHCFLIYPSFVLLLGFVALSVGMAGGGRS